MATIFNRDLLPPLVSYLERDGIRLHHAGRGRLVGRCPKHGAKSKSGRSFMVDCERWRCWGCGVGGDLITYIRWRDGCTFREALATLGILRSLTPAERTEAVRIRQEAEWNRSRKLREEEHARRERLQLRGELHTTARIYRDLNNGLHSAGPTGIEAEKYWGALPPTLDCLRIEEIQYSQAAGLGNPYE
jgi:CHC2-type zinc finger protein